MKIEKPFLYKNSNIKILSQNSVNSSSFEFKIKSCPVRSQLIAIRCKQQI